MRRRGPPNGAAGCAVPTPPNPTISLARPFSCLQLASGAGKPLRAPTGTADNGIMVCSACRASHHEECRGGNWCDCQHKPPAKPREPPMAWIRQG